MLETWAAFKLWVDYLIPLMLFIGIVLVFVMVCTLQSFRWNRKIRWLTKHGFERYLVGVPSVGNGAFYGWKNEKTAKRIDERDVKRLKFKLLVERMRS